MFSVQILDFPKSFPGPSMARFTSSVERTFVTCNAPNITGGKSTGDVIVYIKGRSGYASVNSSIAHPPPPPGNPRAFALFFSSSWQFPGVGQEKRGNARPQGTLAHL